MLFGVELFEFFCGGRGLLVIISKQLIKCLLRAVAVRCEEIRAKYLAWGFVIN